MFNRKIKLVALKVFPFKGVNLQVEEEFEPDTPEQADLLKAIGLAKPKERKYLNRAAAPQRAAVMTTGAPPPPSNLEA